MKAPLLGLLLAIAVTTAMDATGLSMFSALPLVGLTALFWYLQRLSRREMGLSWGRLGDHGLALLHPLLVLGAIVGLVFLLGQVDTSGANWRTAGLNMLAGSTVGVLGVLLTEEGFFRGWLWGSLRRAGVSDTRTLLYTSIAFSLWHVSAVSLDTGFDLPLAQIPVYLVNATIIGVIWGILRLRSGSILVPSLAHAVWNAVAYALFGFGEQVGALGVSQTGLYGPEVGWVGLAASVIFALVLWRRTVAAPSSSDVER